MNGTSPTVTYLYAQAILQAAQRRGIELPADVVGQVVPGERVPLSAQDQLWDHYCESVGEPLAGLEIGLALQVGHLDSAGMLLVSCDTLMDGLDALVEYAPIIGDGGEFSLSESDGQVCLRYRPAYRVRVAERVEAVMASLVRLTGWATGEAFRPGRLMLAHRPLASREDYWSRLPMPVTFEADCNCLCFSREQGTLPLIQANGALRDHLRQLADDTLERLGHHSLGGQVARLVREHPGWGKERVAVELAVSGRHLNRLLGEEGVSFKVLRERELHRMALELLGTGCSVSEASARLAFSEETAFVRAFRRWEGVTPARFRGRS